MTKPKSTLSKLIGSMGPSDSYFEARAQASAKEAQQRWPMFRALAPVANDLTPTLSDQDKERWQHAQRPAPVSHKVSLSRADQSEKLAQGLNKILRQTRSETKVAARKVDSPIDLPDKPVDLPVPSAMQARLTRTPAAPDKPLSAAMRVSIAREEEPPLKPPTLFGKKASKAEKTTAIIDLPDKPVDMSVPTATPGPRMRTQATLDKPRSAATRVGIAREDVQPVQPPTLFVKKVSKIEEPTAMTVTPSAPDGSLNGVFNRLKEKGKKVEADKSPRASFFGRLSKR